MTLDDYVLTATKARASTAPPSLRNPLVAAAWEAALSTFAHRAFKDGVGLDYFYGMVLESRKFFDEFFSATKPAFPESDDRRLWAHQKFGPFENIDPKTDIDIKKVKAIADAYVTKPVIQDPCFSWCLLDSLIFTEIKSFLRVMMATQFGSAPGNPAYFLSKGNEARYDLLRPLFFCTCHRLQLRHSSRRRQTASAWPSPGQSPSRRRSAINLESRPSIVSP